MKKNTLLLARPALLCAAVICSVPLVAQTEPLPPMNDPALPNDNVDRPNSSLRELSRADRKFLEEAAKSGMKEVTISQAVQARLTHPAIRDYAQLMISEHMRANEELKALALRKGISLPPSDDKMLRQWSKENDDLEENYLEEMESDHKKSIDLFEDALDSKDADIAAFARKTLPVLQHHLAQVKQHRKALD